MAITQAQADKAVEESGLGYASCHHRPFAELFPAYTPTPVQRVVDRLPQDEPSLLVIEDMTGSGKTEAALVASGDHFYFGLPTMATANGLWARVSAADTLQGYRTLVHGNRWLVPEAMERATAWLNDSTRRALLSQIGVGTIDQAVLAVLYARHATLRLVGLADKTLIVDEVRAYDEYQRAVLCVLIELQARIGGSVVLLSATLPQAHRSEHAEAWARGREIDTVTLEATGYPLITHITNGGAEETPVQASARRDVRIEEESEFDTVVRRVVAAAQAGQCICWVRNTVNDAIEAWEALQEQLEDVDLFHARFTVGDRQVIEQRVLQNFGKESTEEERRGKVLVATQVVEQSLDLDFDLMISDIAPIDLLIQRAGRLHRHQRGDRGEPVLVVHAPLFSDEPKAGWEGGADILRFEEGNGDCIEVVFDFDLKGVGRLSYNSSGNHHLKTRQSARAETLSEAWATSPRRRITVMPCARWSATASTAWTSIRWPWSCAAPRSGWRPSNRAARWAFWNPVFG